MLMILMVFFQIDFILTAVTRLRLVYQTHSEAWNWWIRVLATPNHFRCFACPSTTPRKVEFHVFLPRLIDEPNFSFAFQENGSRKLPSLAHIHRLKSTDNLEGNAGPDSATTPTLPASLAAPLKTNVPSSPIGAATSITPTAELSSR